MFLQSRKKSIENLCKDFGIDILYVFGSRSKEVVEFLSNDESILSPGPSDIDTGIRLIPGREITIQEKVLLAIRLEDLLGVNRVEVLLSIDPEIGPKVNPGLQTRGSDLFFRIFFLLISNNTIDII